MQEVLIDKVGFQGDGLSRDGIVVPLTLPGERVTVKSGKDCVELDEVLEASPDRVTPPCRHFAACGGCALQHWNMAAYSAWKREVVEAQLRRAGLETQVAAILTTPPASRRRVGLHARKAGKSVELG